MNESIEEMIPDTIVSEDGAVIQHGPLNDRVYLMKMGRDEASARRALKRVESLAAENHYSKIFAKVPASSARVFLEDGYAIEALVPGFFQGTEDGYFLTRYLDPNRRQVSDGAVIRDVLEASRSRGAECRPCILPAGYTLRPAEESDVPLLAALFGYVFETYPFPIHDPDYLRKSMQGNIRYYCALRERRIIAASSAEMDREAGSVELTDFATHPSYRGMGLCSALQERMESDMREKGLQTAYTIARASLYPINITFARAGYRYGGTLFNNTQICGSFESMNVWHKPLVKN
jgi:putative beta-lysine N-acetyltransferase